ncbi:SDR family NAD(P)-dependent oxidoreductase [Paenibacillus jiagnxiensis]|uniref:SDR family NAD(P)-dependent oxidoreductase n=1 Tax=Paenibacillus jiagnxiensis TaxID=3228926 RepID=UPI0033A409FC
MRAFVTGGTGLLGNNLVRLLVEKGWEVKILVRSAGKVQMLLQDLNVEVVIGDLSDVERWAPQMMHCDVLFNTAAYFRETFGRGSHWDSLMKINVVNTLRMFELAEQYGVGKIVHTSSNATIGKRKDGGLSDEGDRLAPDEALNMYGKSKIIGDQAIDEFMQQHRIPVVTVLPAWMFGPGDAAPTGSGQLVLNFLARKIPGYFPSGIDVVDARDVALAMYRAAETALTGQRYILSAHYSSLEELFRFMGKASGIPGPSKSFPKSMVYMSTWFNERLARLRNTETSLSIQELQVMTEMKRTSGKKAQRELSIAYRPLEDTIRDTVKWYLSRKEKYLSAK